jgi:hypothetical protein
VSETVAKQFQKLDLLLTYFGGKSMVEWNRMRVRSMDNTQSHVIPDIGIGRVVDITSGTVRWEGPLGISASDSAGSFTKTWDIPHGRPPYFTGGPFFSYTLFHPSYLSGPSTVRSRIRTGPSGPPGYVPPGHQYYTEQTCNFWIADIPGTVEGMAISSPDDHYRDTNPDDLQSVGNRAYSKLRPKVDVLNIFEDVHDFGDTLPMIKTSAEGFHSTWKALGGGHSSSLAFFKENYKMFPKFVANHYLNHVFGWVQFVSAVNKVCDLAINFDDYSSKAEKNNDRWMDRTFREPKEFTLDVYSDYWNSTNGCDPSMNDSTYVVPWSARHTLTREKTQEVWYKGKFKYYREEFDTKLKSGYPTVRAIRQMTTLLGLEINPTNLYKVMPWTWFADWFGTVGDGITRFQDMADNSVVSKYFYLMRHTIDVFRQTHAWQDYGGGSHSHSWVKGVETKLRVGSEDPFNFSLSLPNFSKGQLAILAALGITRV